MKNNNPNFVAMAIARGSISKEGTAFPKYVGVAPFFVRAFNPTKAELEKFGITVKEEPVYIGTQEIENNGVKENVQIARPTFLLQSDAERCGVDMTFLLSMPIRNQYYIGRNTGKYQVIDEFARTAWATVEDIQEHRIPVYSSGPASVTANYRPSLVGEEDLMKFIIAYINIPSITKFKDGVAVGMKDNPEDSECRFDTIQKFFTGNFKELKDALSYQPDNKVKVCLGVSEDSEGHLHQVAFKGFFLKNAVNNLDKMDAEIKDALSRGAYASTDFTGDHNMSSIGLIKEYSVEPTDFTVPSAPSFNVPSAPSSPAGGFPWAK